MKDYYNTKSFSKKEQIRKNPPIIDNLFSCADIVYKQMNQQQPQNIHITSANHHHTYQTQSNTDTVTTTDIFVIFPSSRQTCWEK